MKFKKYHLIPIAVILFFGGLIAVHLQIFIPRKDCSKIYINQGIGNRLSTGAFCVWSEHDGCGNWSVFIPNDAKSSIIKYTSAGYNFWKKNKYGFWYSKHVSWPSQTPPGYNSDSNQAVIYGKDCNFDILFIKQIS